MSDSDNNYMSLASGVGIIPEAQRNRAYDKLGIKPGEGGLREPRPEKTDGSDIDSFLAAVAAGADPVKLAEKLRGATTTTRKRAA